MKLALDKTLEDLNNQVISELRNNGFSVTPGAICKLILLIYNKILHQFYTVLTRKHVMAFLSTAKGEAIDAIGILLNCKRLYNEEDDLYRDRISKQVLSLASANEVAVRLAALSVEGVQDVITKKFTYGSGSFSMYVITNDILASDNILKQTRKAVNKAVACGIKYTVNNPKLLKIKIKIKIFLSNNVTSTEKQEIISMVTSAIQKYFTSIKIGGSIIPNQLTEEIMNTSKKILNYKCYELRINNKLANYTYQECRQNQRFILSQQQDSILIS